MTEFTPIEATIGGVLIGFAAVWFMAANGRIAGIAGVLNRLLPPYLDDALADRLAFTGGLIAAPLLYVLAGGSVVVTVPDDNALLVTAGLLVGFGSTIGSGCTSGHGVCGLSRLSKRSLVATAIFMATGVLTVLLVRHVA